jgi:hypothetical protein
MRAQVANEPLSGGRAATLSGDELQNRQKIAPRRPQVDKAAH